MSALNTSLGMCLVLTAGVAVLSQARPQTPLPTFRTGIDVVELDVTVLDKDRRPVRGLRAADFSILERGQPQPIVAFAAIDVPAPAAAAPWIRDGALDVVNNESENRRLVIIMMDDAYTNSSPSVMKRAKQIGYAAIEELGPNGLAAVTFTFQGRVQNFTYQGGKGRLLPVKMSAKVTDARNEVVGRYDLVLEPEQFGAARAAEYRVGLPLAHLDPGDYLFEVEARNGAPLVRRTVKFSIARGGP